ncbi:SDR family NAD(P)-dependent oxidoreductase [Paracoccus sp. (in: a-proteobacteria)]|uniref:SDR family NAD(P)-dependent oxidoreductase n=1 Tax=Paracoccus sp. TaxID=267 RepID=UPI003A8BF2EA
MTISLQGKVVVVTGAARGIGAAIARAMAAAGAAVVVNDVDAAEAEGIATAIRDAGGRAATVIAAIGENEAAQLCVDTALSQFGRLDSFCANAGVLRDGILWKATDEDFDLVIRTHLRGAFTCGRAAARHFREAGHGGSIILMSSPAGQRGNVGQTAYASAKAGVAALARTWSMELARANVSVNAIVPTALTRMVATIPGLADAVAAVDAGQPVPHHLRHDLGLGRPEDVAPLAVWLASDRGHGVSGQCIGIGGDRLALWSHPQEIAVRQAEGGWSADAIARAWDDTFDEHRQDAGLKLDI